MHSGEMSNKCNLCDYASAEAGSLRTHLNTHSGEKSNKCNQCDYASSHAGNLRQHLKTHSGEKSNKCNLWCDFASIYSGNLKVYFKTYCGEKSNKCNFVWASRTHLKMHSRAKVKQMQLLQLRIYPCTRSQESYEKNVMGKVSKKHNTNVFPTHVW